MKTEAGTIARWVDAGWEYAYIVDGMVNHAQYQMKCAFGMGKVRVSVG
jgi:hypothetical protein